MFTPRFRLALISLGALSAGMAFAQSPSIHADETPLTGALPNGVKYLVLPHASPKGDISLRLVVRRGSLDEHDDERGFAHFVEHMAFDGTTHHPPGTLVNLFQNLGLTLGPDVNAATSYAATQYLLDLPAGRSEHLDECIGVLRDYADGLLFVPQQVKRESGVVISELNARDSSGRRTSKQQTDVIFAGTLLVNREVAGVAAQLARATAEQLRAFYQRTYLADRMTVVVVGPIDPALTVQKIVNAFSSMSAANNGASETPMLEPAKMDGVKPDVLVVPTAKGADVQLIAINHRAPDNAEGRKRELRQRMATAILSNRLRDRRERQDITQFAPPRVAFDDLPFSGLQLHTIEVPSSASSWDDAVGMIETELRRARTSGFTQVELDEAAAGQLAYARNRVSDFSGMPAAPLAAQISQRLMSDRKWLSPELEFNETTEFLQGLKPSEVAAEIDAIFPRNALHLLLIVPPDLSVKPAHLLAEYTKSANHSVSTKAATGEALVFHYGNFGPAGAIARKEHLDDLDLTTAEFANGVRLNLHPTLFEPGRFRLRVVFPVNFSDQPTDGGGIAELAGQLLVNSDLRKHNQTEITRLLKLRGITSSLDVTQGTPHLNISGASAELTFALQFLTALLSDLDFDREHYNVALGRYSAVQHAEHLNPASLALRAALLVYTNGDRRVVLNPPQVFMNQAGEDLAGTWVTEHLLSGPLEIGLVGDFNADDALAAASTTIGTLKRRRPFKASAPLASPQKPNRQEGSAELPASTSMSCTLWPITLTPSPRTNAALELATDVLRDRETAYLREKLSSTYSPQTRIFRDAVQRDFAYVSLVNTFESTQAQKLTVTSLAVAIQLSEKGVTTEEFNRLREPAKSRVVQDLHSNAWWLASVAVVQRRPELLAVIRQHEQIFDEVTIEDVNAAAKVFGMQRFISVVLHPASAKIAPIDGRKK